MIGRTMRTLSLICFISVLSVSSHAVGLDSLRQYRVTTYSLIGMDTSGNDFLPTVEMDRYIRLGIDQLPVWVMGDEARTTIVTVDGQRWYSLDSNVIQLNWVAKIDSGGFVPIKIKAPEEFQDIAPFNYQEADASTYVPELCILWRDSIQIYPPPTHNANDNLSDTIEVAYWKRHFDSSNVITVPSEYQFGVVLYAVWLSEKRKGVGKARAALEDYILWAKRMNMAVTRKLLDPLRDER